MRAPVATPERLGAFSDGVIAVIITIMVLELKPPGGKHLRDLLPLWPTALSYGVSYLFVGIVWINHHHLLRYTEHATPGLIWANLLMLFPVSLIPFATSWMAVTGLAPVPTAFYALVFCLVNVSYTFFLRTVLQRPDAQKEPELLHLRRRSRVRSQVTLLVYISAGLLALRFPLAGFALLCLNTLAYAVPEHFAARAAQPWSGAIVPTEERE